MKFSLAKAMFLGLAMATGIAACSSRTAYAPSESASGGEHASSVGYELRLGRTTHITKASYTLTCPGGFSKSGTIDVSKLSEFEGSISGLPPGGPCSLTLTATSTNGNVTCSGSKGGLTVTCPGNRSQDENHFKVICTRNHQGREWGDNDWKENSRTFQLGAELNLVCATSDAGADAASEAEAGPEPTPEAGPDADSCAPSNAACGTQTCGTVPDGCGTGGMVNCGPMNGACATGLTCVAPGTCVPCAVVCPAGQNCGSFSNPAGCPISVINCGSCPFPDVCGGGVPPVPNVCCRATPPATACGTQTCGTASDGCGGTVACGPNGGACPFGMTCDGLGHCGDSGCQSTCPAGDNCGTITNLAGCPIPTVQCGTCPTTNPNEVCGGGPNPRPNVCGCTPTPAATACGSRICGTAPDGCGGTVPCGPLNGACPAGLLCGPFGQCIECNPVCPAGDTCGTILNNPGCGVISCGTCSNAAPFENTTCGGGGVPNHCGCLPTPAATACGTQVCGTAPDGCGGTVPCGALNGGCPGSVGCGPTGQCIECVHSCPAGENCGIILNNPGCPVLFCGTCATGTTCVIPAGGTAGTCGSPPPNNCDGSKSTSSTLGCLQQQNKATTTDPTKVCSACVASNGCFDPRVQGGTCETVAGNATLFSGTLSDGKTCAQVFSPLTPPVSEKAVCLDVLDTLFTSKCAGSLQLGPCLCGTLDIPSCLAGFGIPTGPAYDEYACDFNSTSTQVIDTISTDFVVQTFGAGQANALVQCAATFGCDCF